MGRPVQCRGAVSLGDVDVGVMCDECSEPRKIAAPGGIYRFAVTSRPQEEAGKLKRDRASGDQFPHEGRSTPSSLFQTERVQLPIPSDRVHGSARNDRIAEVIEAVEFTPEEFFSRRSVEA